MIFVRFRNVCSSIVHNSQGSKQLPFQCALVCANFRVVHPCSAQIRGNQIGHHRALSNYDKSRQYSQDLFFSSFCSLLTFARLREKIWTAPWKDPKCHRLQLQSVKYIHMLNVWVYLPTFGCFLGQMLAHIPYTYMEHMGMGLSQTVR